MKDLTGGLRVYEVVAALHDEDGNYLECDESEYLVYIKGQEPDCEQMIKDSGLYVTDRLVQIYSARSGHLIFNRNGQIDDHDDIDCATGLNGSPIHEVLL